MNAPNRNLRLLGIAVAAIVAIGAAAALGILQPWSAGNSFAAAPFDKAADDYPRILPVEGKPNKSDKDGLSKYYAARKKVWSYISEQGAIQRATADEREAVKLVREEKYVRGWEAAVKVLRDNPESAPGWYALADAELHGEKSLPRALHAVRKARRILEKRGQANPHDADSREWYIVTLSLEYHVLRGLERFDEALLVVDLLEQTYQPMPWLKVWPLFKLNRIADAEAAIAATEQTGKWKSTALNDRLVLEQQHRRRSSPYQLGREIVKLEGDSAVLWSNLGEVALGDFRIPDAEAAYLKSAKLGKPNFYGTAYTPLTLLLMQKGEFREALTARRLAQEHRALREPHTLQYDHGRVDRSIALLLTAIGQSSDAERFARRMHALPDRLGSITTRPDDQDLGNDLLLATVLTSRLEQQRELARDDGGFWTSRINRLLIESEIWNLEHRIRRIVVTPSRLNDLRPNVPDGAMIETWMIGNLMQMLPPSVALKMVRQARAEEQAAAEREGSDVFTRAAPYFDALEAEAVLLAGRPDDALELARRAIDALPNPGVKLLIGRTAAVAAEAARQLGRLDESRNYYERALADAPIMFRLLKLAIPVRFETDASPAAEAVRNRLAQSPRFRDDSNGFTVTLRTENDQLKFQLTRGNTTHCEGSAPITGQTSDDATNAAAVFHQHVLSPQLHLTEVEVIALDDSPAAIKTRIDTDKRLDEVRPKRNAR